MFILSLLVSVAVGVVVVRQNPRRAINQVYGLLTLAFIVLGVANYMSLSTGTDHVLLYMRLTIVATTVALTSLYFLIVLLCLGGPALRRQRGNLLILLFSGLVACLDVTPLVFSGLVAGERATPAPGLGAVLFLAHFLLLVSLSISLLARTAHRRKGLVRLQSLYILAGLVPTFIFAPLTGVILPIAFYQTQFVFLTPLYAAFFVSMIAYAIIRHRLFDVRLAVVRSVAYLGVLLTLSAIYYAMAYSLSFAFGADASAHVSQLSVAIALVLAFMFQPVKRFLDKLTNSIFYRDNYSTDEFFARINRVLNATTELRSLLQHAATEVAGTIKAEQAYFFVRYDESRFTMAGTQGYIRLSMHDIAYVDSYIAEHTGPVVADMFNESEPMRLFMRRRGLAVILPLKVSDRFTGYLFLGASRGRNYTERDIRLLETISDELVIAIQNALSVQEVREVNSTLQQRIADATKELRTSNRQLQKLDEAKDEFVSMASHQLRTPLTSVKGYISMVLEGDAGEITPMQRKLLGEAFTSSERMVHLINDFLNVSRLQTGKFMLDAQATDLAKVVRQEVDALKSVAAAHGLRLEYRPPTRIPVLYVDEGKIRQVIMNFLDNAIYYSRENTAIKVTLSHHDGDVMLEVHDTGIGVPLAEQAHLFTKFFRATNARRQRPDGTGVGLFLAKKVITSHGGRMIFSSVEGEGSVFGFRLPVKKLLEAPARGADELEYQPSGR